MAETWLIQDGGKSKSITERTLRQKLREGNLSGMELVRPPDAAVWTSLHSLPIFAEEVPHTGDPRQAAVWRQVTGFLSHLAVFIAVMVFLGFPWWGIFWALGVFGHAVPVLQTLRSLQSAPPAVPVTPTAAATPVPVLPTPEVAVEVVDPFLARLDALLAPLQAEGEAVDAIRTEAVALHHRRASLAAVLDETDSAALHAELQERQQAAAQATSASDQETFSREVAALSARLEATQGLAQAHERLAAQERELLHHLEGIRMARLQAAVEGEGRAAAADEVAARLQEARQRLQATTEIEERLTAARRAAASARSRGHQS